MTISFRLLLASLIGFVLSNQALALRGHSDDIKVLVEIDKSQAQAILAPGLKLEETTSDKHPVEISFGLQRGVATLPPYYEIIVTVPRVQFIDRTRGKHEFYNFYHVLYLNNRVAVWGGVLFDSPKILARIRDNGKQFTSAVRGRLNFSVNYAPSTEKELSTKHVNFLKMKEYLSGPSLTYKNGRFNCWGVKRRNHRVVPLKANVKILPGFIKGVTSLQKALQGLDVSPFGAYKESSNWVYSSREC